MRRLLAVLGSQVYDNYKDPMYPAALARPTSAMPELLTSTREILGAELYR